MALKLEKNIENGIQLKYGRIVSIFIHVNEQCIIEVAGYPSQEKRIEEQIALAEARETGEYPETNIYIKTISLCVDYDPELNVVKAYQILKATEEFSEAEDIIEN